jgi:xylulose-5-phosphate/fructose-6-phosphate phosphoketolase
MIILKTQKGWTGLKVVDGVPIEETFRTHQVPIEDMDKTEHLRVLENWMKSYKPEELFDEQGTFRAEFAENAPKGERRMSADPHANGGLLLRELELPDSRG